MQSGIELNVEPAERVTHEDIGRRDPGAGEERPQLLDDPPPAAGLRVGIAVSDPRAVVGAHPRLPGDLRLDLEPTDPCVPAAGIEDHRRPARAFADDVET